MITIPPPPPSEKKQVKENLHGTEILDNFQWLEDQKSDETRSWIKSQNEYTKSLLDKLPFREKIEKRVAELVHIDVIQKPVVRKNRYFFNKRKAEQDLPIVYLKEGANGKEEALIDPHEMSEEHTLTVTIEDVSFDGSILAYGICEGGEDEICLRFLDVNQRKELPDQLPKARYFGVSLAPDNSGFYYTYYDDKIGSRVRFHKMGTEVKEDQDLFGEEYGPEKIIYATLSEDGAHLLMHVLYGSAADQSELHYKNLAENGPVVSLVNDLPAQFFGHFGGDAIYINTNWNAPKKRILKLPLSQLKEAPSNWKEIIPEAEGTIEEIALVDGKIVINYLENVVSKVKIFETDGTFLRDLSLPSIGSVSDLSGHWGDAELFLVYSSFHIPTTIYRVNLAKEIQEVWAKLEIPLEAENFEVKQIWYTSKDKTKIPMFLMHQKGLELNGENPTLITGYGGFNVSRTPDFNQLAVLWVEQGGVFALPSLRGGGEFGEDWHKAGTRERKQNVFDDFIFAAEWLIQQKYTKKEKLAAIGGSNGGLLVGAMLTQRPDLFRAIGCFYPLLDMIRYHKFLVARFWVPEYGSAENPEEFKYLLEYSPYHQVKPGTSYPAVIFVTGDADTRVAPLHARKMAAILQEANGSKERPILLYYDTKLGHAGGQPAHKQIEDITSWLTFLLWQLDVVA